MSRWGQMSNLYTRVVSHTREEGVGICCWPFNGACTTIKALENTQSFNLLNTCKHMVCCVIVRPVVICSHVTESFESAFYEELIGSHCAVCLYERFEKLEVSRTPNETDTGLFHHRSTVCLTNLSLNSSNDVVNVRGGNCDISSRSTNRSIIEVSPRSVSSKHSRFNVLI